MALWVAEHSTINIHHTTTQHTTRNTQHTTHNTQQLTKQPTIHNPRQLKTYNLQLATCNSQLAAYNLQLTACRLQLATYIRIAFSCFHQSTNRCFALLGRGPVASFPGTKCDHTAGSCGFFFLILFGLIYPRGRIKKHRAARTGPRGEFSWDQV